MKNMKAASYLNINTWYKYFLVGKLLLIIGIGLSPLQAQPTAMFSFFRENISFFNPASPALNYINDPSTDLSFNAAYRQQWIAPFPDAPRFFGASGQLIKEKNIIGIQALQDQAGGVKNGTFALSYAYKFRLDNEYTPSQFSMGLSVGIRQWMVNTDGVHFVSPDDDALATSFSSTLIPEVSFGISWFKVDKYFFDLSALNLIALTNSSLSKVTQFEQKPWLCGAMGHYILLGDNEDNKLLPAFYFNLLGTSNLFAFDLRYYHNTFWFSLGSGYYNELNAGMGVAIKNDKFQNCIGFKFGQPLQSFKGSLGVNIELNYSFSLYK